MCGSFFEALCVTENKDIYAILWAMHTYESAERASSDSISRRFRSKIAVTLGTDTLQSICISIYFITHGWNH